MAGTMKAAVLVKPQKFEIHERPIPKPSAGEVLIRVSRCGICGTDIHIFNGHYAADSLPMVPGHEFTGTIAAIGRCRSLENWEKGRCRHEYRLRHLLLVPPQ